MDLIKVQNFMYMLLKEASRVDLVELCEEYDIEEDEIDLIIEYINGNLGLGIKID